MSAGSVLDELRQGLADIKGWLHRAAYASTSRTAKAESEAAIQRQQAAKLVDRLDVLATELNAVLDLATDPSVNLARQMQDLRRENAQLLADKRELTAQFNRTRSHFQELNVGLTVKLRQEEQRGKRVLQELARLESELGRDPKLFQEFLDRSITDERIVEAKPDEFDGKKRRK